MNTIDKWNNDVLKKQGVKQTSKAPKIIRSAGDAKQATLWDNTVVKRQDYIYVDDIGLVRCAPYELHFIYVAPPSHKGWGLWCSCGSIAGVIGTKDYSKLLSPVDTGWMLVCIRHNTTKLNNGIGTHADQSHE